MFPSRFFPSSFFARRYFPDRGTAYALPAMPALAGYIVVTIDGVRYALWASRLDP